MSLRKRLCLFTVLAALLAGLPSTAALSADSDPIRPTRYTASDEDQIINDRYFVVEERVNYVFKDLPGETRARRGHTSVKLIALIQTKLTKRIRFEHKLFNNWQESANRLCVVIFVVLLFSAIWPCEWAARDHRREDLLKNFAIIGIAFVGIMIVLWMVWLYTSGYNYLYIDNPTRLALRININGKSIILAERSHCMFFIPSGLYNLSVVNRMNGEICNERIYIPRGGQDFCEGTLVYCIGGEQTEAEDWQTYRLILREYYKVP